MKLRMRKLLAFMIVLCITLPFCITTSFAAVDDYSIQHWNVMLVIDDTKSMYNQTDKNGVRYEAIDSFIDTLWNKGDYVGVILFRANNWNDSSEEDMRRGLVVDTWKNGTVALENNKTNLKKQILKTDIPTDNFTDLGTALYTAEKHLEKACAENGLPGAIYVLTDGFINLSYNTPMAKARENLETAIAGIKENNYVFCGAFLNGANEQHNELRDTVTRANSYVDGDLILGRYYFEIDAAEDIPYTMDKFMELLGFYMPEGEKISSSCDKFFNIPGTGAAELNIRFRTENSTKMPDMNVTIIRPNGSKLSSDEIKAIYSFSDSYVLYKIHEPDAGTWTIHVELPANNTVQLSYDRIFNTYIEAAIKTTPEPEQIHSNMTVTVQGFLSKHGELITDKDSYLGYDCKLVLTEELTGTQYEYPIIPDSNDEYILELPLDQYMKCSAKITFACNEFYADSDEQVWDLTNRQPTCSEIAPMELTCSILEDPIYTIDMDDYIDDLEDGKNLSISLQGVTCNNDGVTLQNKTISIDPLKAGSGTISVRVSDSQGAFQDVDIPVNVFVSKIEAVMETSPSPETLRANKTVKVEAYLTDEGNKLKDFTLYKGYECSLHLRNNETDEISKYPIEVNDNNTYLFDFEGKPIDFYGIYEAQVQFSHGINTILTPIQNWDLHNRQPACQDREPIELKYFYINTPIKPFYKQSIESIDIKNRYSDEEDRQDQLSLSVSTEGFDSSAVKLEGNEILIQNLKAIDSGVIIVTVTDTQGAKNSFKIPITCKDYTVPILIAVGIILLIILILILLAIRKRNSYYPKGTCTLEFDVTDDNDKDVTLNVNLTPPGNGTKRKTNLYAMLSSDMMMQAGSVRAACDAENIEFSTVERYINNISADLKKVEVSCVVGKQKDLGKIGKVCIADGKKKEVLFNNASTIRPGGHAMAFGYYLHSNSGIDDDYNIDNPYSSDDTNYDSGYSSYSSYSDDEDDF